MYGCALGLGDTEARFASCAHLRNPAVGDRRVVGRRPGTKEVAVQIPFVNIDRCPQGSVPWVSACTGVAGPPTS